MPARGLKSGHFSGHSSGHSSMRRSEHDAGHMHSVGHRWGLWFAATALLAIAVLLTLTGSRPSYAQEPTPPQVQTSAPMALPEHWPDTWDELEAALSQRAERLGIDYAEVVIFNARGRLQQTRLGVGQARTGDETAPKLLSGQLTEVLTALTVMQLIERGEWSLFDRVDARLPQVTISNPYQDQQPLLLIHLLEHSSGLDQRRFKSHFATNATTGLDLLARLEREQQTLTLRWQPGAASRQSALNYVLVAAMLEQYFQRPWADIVQEYVLEPLGLGATTTRFSAADAHAQGFRNLPAEPVPPQGRVFPEAEGSWTSMDDVVRLGRHLLSRGSSSSPAILRADSFATMEIPRSTQASDAGLLYGMGLAIDSRARYGLWYGRQSSLDGYSMNLRYRTEHDIGYAIVVNHETLLPALDELVWQYLATQIPQAPSRAGGVTVEQRWAGWYRLQNPEHQLLAPVQRVFDIAHMQREGSYLTLQSLFGPTVPLRSADGSRLAHRQDGSVVGVLYSDETGTQKLQVHNDVRYKVSALQALAPPLLIIFGVIILLTHPFGRADSLNHPWMRRATSLAGVCMLLAAFVGGSLSLEQASHDNWRSVLLFVLTSLGPILAFLGLFLTLAYWRSEPARVARWRCLLGALTAVSFALWMIHSDWFALRVWAW